MQGPQRKLADINRLLACYPAGSGTEPEQVLRNYLLAVDDYPADDVTGAVDAFIKGSAPGVNANFLPPAPSVGAECRRQMHLRLDRENRERKLRPALPAPLIERSPEDRASVKAMVDDLVARTAERIDTGETKRRVGVLEKTNARFYPDMDEREVAARLGFSVGDPEDEAHAA